MSEYPSSSFGLSYDEKQEDVYRHNVCKGQANFLEYLCSSVYGWTRLQLVLSIAVKEGGPCDLVEDGAQ
jgi:hypothetical protein